MNDTYVYVVDGEKYEQGWGMMIAHIRNLHAEVEDRERRTIERNVMFGFVLHQVQQRLAKLPGGWGTFLREVGLNRHTVYRRLRLFGALGCGMGLVDESKLSGLIATLRDVHEIEIANGRMSLRQVEIALNLRSIPKHDANTLLTMVNKSDTPVSGVYKQHPNTLLTTVNNVSNDDQRLTADEDLLDSMEAADEWPDESEIDLDEGAAAFIDVAPALQSKPAIEVKLSAPMQRISQRASDGVKQAQLTLDSLYNAVDAVRNLACSVADISALHASKVTEALARFNAELDAISRMVS